jgi:hypothetical protein
MASLFLLPGDIREHVAKFTGPAGYHVKALTEFVSYDEEIILYHARNGEMVMVKSLVKQGLPLNAKRAAIIAVCNRDDILFQYLARRIDISQSVYKAIINGQNLEELKWLVKHNHSVSPWRFIVRHVGKIGNLDMAKWIFARFTCDDDCSFSISIQYISTIWNQAIAYGHLPIIEWLHRDCEDYLYNFTEDECAIRAAKAGHLEVVEHFLRPASDSFVHMLAKIRKIFIRQNNELDFIEFDKRYLNVSYDAEDYEICNIVYRSYKDAITLGRLWAIDYFMNLFPEWEWRGCSIAIKSANAQSLKHMIGSETSATKTDWWIEAADFYEQSKNKYYPILEILGECEVPGVGVIKLNLLKVFLRHGNFELAKKAHEKGFRIPNTAYTTASRMGRVDVLNWLCDNQTRWYVRQMHDILKLTDCVDVIEWFITIKKVNIRFDPSELPQKVFELLDFYHLIK